MNQYLLLLCSLAATGFGDSGTLSLEQALELARANSPALRAARMQTHAAEQAVGVAGLWINPNLSFEAEGVGGDLDGFSETEYTVSLEQRFARGGKRRSERNVARQAMGVAFAREGEKERELLAEVRSAFVEVLTQQEMGKIRSEQEKLGRAFVEVSKKRHEAGGGSELEVVQAELSLEETILSQSCCFGDLAAAREKLASLIGIPVKELGRLAGDCFVLETPDAGTIADSHPVLRRMEAEVATLRAEAALAKARDATDITLGFGIRHEEAGGVDSLVFGGSIPLNFVRHGRISQTVFTARADALEGERAEVRRKLQQELSVGIARYSGARLEAETVRDRLIPKAEKAYELSLAGYKTGRFSWLELIAAQQRLADIRIRQIEALKDAHLAWAEIYKFKEEI